MSMTGSRSKRHARVGAVPAPLRVQEGTMPAIKRILVPTDFSPSAEQALRYAADLPLAEKPELTILHVFQFPSYFFPDGSVITSSPDMVEQLTIQIDRSLVAAADLARAAGALNPQTLSVNGVPFAEIVRVSREGGFDLIVIGTHGHTGLAHVILGSVAEKVVRKATCPVLTVRTRDKKD
jgi:nucleotide-binding universal stress UspA family protein